MPLRRTTIRRRRPNGRKPTRRHTYKRKRTVGVRRVAKRRRMGVMTGRGEYYIPSVLKYTSRTTTHEYQRPMAWDVDNYQREEQPEKWNMQGSYKPPNTKANIIAQRHYTHPSILSTTGGLKPNYDYSEKNSWRQALLSQREKELEAGAADAYNGLIAGLIGPIAGAGLYATANAVGLPLSPYMAYSLATAWINKENIDMVLRKFPRNQQQIIELWNLMPTIPQLGKLRKETKNPLDPEKPDTSAYNELNDEPLQWWGGTTGQLRPMQFAGSKYTHDNESAKWDGWRSNENQDQGFRDDPESAALNGVQVAPDGTIGEIPMEDLMPSMPDTSMAGQVDPNNGSMGVVPKGKGVDVSSNSIPGSNIEGMPGYRGRLRGPAVGPRASTYYDHNPYNEQSAGQQTGTYVDANGNQQQIPVNNSNN